MYILSSNCHFPILSNHIGYLVIRFDLLSLRLHSHILLFARSRRRCSPTKTSHAWKDGPDAFSGFGVRLGGQCFCNPGLWFCHVRLWFLPRCQEYFSSWRWWSGSALFPSHLPSPLYLSMTTNYSPYNWVSLSSELFFWLNSRSLFTFAAAPECIYSSSYHTCWWFRRLSSPSSWTICQSTSPSPLSAALDGCSAVSFSFRLCSWTFPLSSEK